MPQVSSIQCCVVLCCVCVEEEAHKAEDGLQVKDRASHLICPLISAAIIDPSRDKLLRTDLYASREARHPSEVALGLRKPLKAVPTSGLLLYARNCLKRQQHSSLSDTDEMSSNSMLPPSASQQHLNNGSTPCRMKSDSQSQQQLTTEDGVNKGPNLNDESMMVLSQSVDSIHTVGTNAGSDALDVSLPFYQSITHFK